METAIAEVSRLGYYGFETFGPDIGQLQKGEVDPVKVVKDYLPLIRHMHLKDYSGGDANLGYCPLGHEKVEIPAVLDLAGKADLQGVVMVELDPSPKMPVAAVARGRKSPKRISKSLVADSDHDT